MLNKRLKMFRLLIQFASVGLLMLPTGCAHDIAVIDSSSDIVRIGSGVRGPVYIYKDGQWIMAGKMTLPEGWYAGPFK